MSSECFEKITEGHKKDPEYQIGEGRKVKRYLIAVPHDFDPKSFNGVEFSKKKLKLVTESGVYFFFIQEKWFVLWKLKIGVFNANVGKSTSF